MAPTAAAGASRLLGPVRALQSDHLHSSTSPSSIPYRLPSLKFPWNIEKRNCRPNHQGTWTTTSVAASLDMTVIAPEKQLGKTSSLEIGRRTTGLPSRSFGNELVRTVRIRLFGQRWPSLTKKCWTTIFEIFLEKGIIGCQSFTFIAVAGSLVGSVLCFVEGCFLVLESFFQYFRTLSQRVDHGEIIKLLVEAIDMFLLGTALLTFGLGLYVMFANSNEIKKKNRWQTAQSNFGLFSLKKFIEGIEMQSISQAKSRIAHAVLLILQGGVLDKFKNVPLVSGLDLACFAGAVFVFSACVLLLSKLTMMPSRSMSI
ncbi:uncharacterized protein [Typha latifolia]|uniref:uncharacterized protein n=1 Tax=Typha latifolia TaxID=4733 RepID=UPI003C3022A7